MEDANKLEDTVIVLTADHYPYGLSSSVLGSALPYSIEEKYDFIFCLRWSEPKAEENGVWKTVEAYELAEGTQFKVRQGKSWDVSFGNGGENFVVDADGTYIVQFDSSTETVSLIAQ